MTFAAKGYRVLGTATSGQAARGLRDGAEVEAFTVASLTHRLDHGRLHLDHRTVVLIDEVGMTDDRSLLRLLTAIETAGAKAVMIGDHRQLSAVGPGGSLEALVARHPDAVHVLDQNIRQHDPAERAALEQLRHGDPAIAVDWYATHGRITTSPTRTDTIRAAVDAWSRARATTHVHAVADNLDQARDDLTRDWTTDRRDRWIHDQDRPALPHERIRPVLAPRHAGGGEGVRAVEGGGSGDQLTEHQRRAEALTRRLDALQQRDHETPARGLGLG